MSPEPVERKLAALLSADAVGYSRLMACDEQATIHTITAYRTEISTLVTEHRGRVVDAPGDNLLAEFPTALDAVECAVEIQRVLLARNQGLPVDRRGCVGLGPNQVTLAQQNISSPKMGGQLRKGIIDLFQQFDGP